MPASSASFLTRRRRKSARARASASRRSRGGGRRAPPGTSTGRSRCRCPCPARRSGRGCTAPPGGRRKRSARPSRRPRTDGRRFPRRRGFEDLERADVDVPFAAALGIEKRVGNGERNLVTKLRRANRVAVDEDVGHGRSRSLGESHPTGSPGRFGPASPGSEGSSESVRRVNRESDDCVSRARRSAARVSSMHAAYERALALSSFWDEELRKELPDGADVFDAHTHLGDDIDGMKGRLEELVGIDGLLRRLPGVHVLHGRPTGTQLHRRERPDAGRRERSNGRLIPSSGSTFGKPIEEARRRLELGARGIKLDPRAQRFLLNDARLAPVFEIASEWRVPILIHGGRRLPPADDSLHGLVESHPVRPAIIADAGIARLWPGPAGELRRQGRVFFDIVECGKPGRPARLLPAGRAGAGRLCLGLSLRPQPGSSLLIALRMARAAELRRRTRASAPMFSGTAEPDSGRRACSRAEAPRGSDVLSQPMVFARIHGHLSMATSCSGFASRTRSASSASRSTRAR